MGRKNLPQLQWAESLTKASVEAGASSWLELNLNAPAVPGTAKIHAWPWKQTGIKENECGGFYSLGPTENSKSENQI